MILLVLFLDSILLAGFLVIKRDKDKLHDNKIYRHTRYLKIQLHKIKKYNYFY